MNAKILIVEDEQELSGLIADYMNAANFITLQVHDGNKAISAIQDFDPDLIVLDLMLPGKNGLDICKEVRAHRTTPIIITTAKTEEIDRLLGLELGADDYLCKPYSPRELVARVKAILRRCNTTEELDKQYSLKVIPDNHQVKIANEDCQLTAVEFALFYLLYKEPGRIFSRNQIMDKIYSDYRVVSERTIDSHIKKLRKKLTEQGNGQEFIHSVYGLGYKFEPGA